MMDEKTIQISKNEFDTQILNIDSLEKLSALETQYLSKKGVLSGFLQHLRDIEPDKRRDFGKEINQLKEYMNQRCSEIREQLETKVLEKKLENEYQDVTLPNRLVYSGSIHPISKTLHTITSYFSGKGFSVADGPEIEDEEHNFGALNIPENHPARQMHDTFYVKHDNKKMVLRTHTSPVQIRYMKQHQPPFKIVAPGRVYRHDSDLTHTPMFHQLEGLYVDKRVSFGQLKSCLESFLSAFFEKPDLKIRFRPSFFPFTEPSAEIDIACHMDHGYADCSRGDQWLEVAGCGMVHPNVLRNSNIDPDKYQGFAFGLGIERLAMLKYGIGDLRQFFDNDYRWLKHYSFNMFGEQRK